LFLLFIGINFCGARQEEKIDRGKGDFLFFASAFYAIKGKKSETEVPPGML
jgi:hypothetical protein